MRQASPRAKWNAIARRRARPAATRSATASSSVARERAKTALGARYDIKDFHEAGLNCGRVPLDILDGVIDRYIREAKA